MLECKTYTKAEIAAILGTNDRQGIKRMLDRHGITYSLDGRADKLKITIIELGNSFKEYCISELGFAPNTDFTKVRNLFYYFLNDEEFSALPDEVKEQRMQEVGMPITRQSIAKYLQRLYTNEYYSPNIGNYIYYFASGNSRKMCDRSTYSQAWAEYWEAVRAGYGSRYAMGKMISTYGGAARKQAIPAKNGIYNKELEHLNDLIIQSFEDEKTE